jgi:hypothetical protein
MFRNREEAIAYKGLVATPGNRGDLGYGADRPRFSSTVCDLAEEVRRGQTETTLDGFATVGRVAYGGRVDRTGQPTAVKREIANYTRAIARGDFASLEVALAVAENRRTTLISSGWTGSSRRPSSNSPMRPSSTASRG